MSLIVDHSPDPSDFHAFLNTEKMAEYFLSDGDIIEIFNQSRKYLVSVIGDDSVQSNKILMNRALKVNSGFYIGSRVSIKSFTNIEVADCVVFSPILETIENIDGDFNLILKSMIDKLKGIPIHKNFVIPICALNRIIEFKAILLSPSNYVVIKDPAVIACQNAPIARNSHKNFELPCFDDIGGFKNTMIMTALESQESNVFFISAPPGCGKTFLGQIIENETVMFFEQIKGLQILAVNTKNGIKQIEQITNDVIENSPSVLYIDDFDFIAEELTNENGEKDYSLAKCLLDNLNKLKYSQNVIVFCTMKPDACFISHFRENTVRVDIQLPNYKQRLSILKAITRKVTSIDNSLLEEIAKKSEGKSAADLKQMIEEEILESLVKYPDECSSLKFDDFFNNLALKPPIDNNSIENDRFQSYLDSNSDDNSDNQNTQKDYENKYKRKRRRHRRHRRYNSSDSSENNEENYKNNNGSDHNEDVKKDFKNDFKKGDVFDNENSNSSDLEFRKSSKERKIVNKHKCNMSSDDEIESYNLSRSSSSKSKSGSFKHKNIQKFTEYSSENNYSNEDSNSEQETKKQTKNNKKIEQPQKKSPFTIHSQRNHDSGSEEKINHKSNESETSSEFDEEKLNRNIAILFGKKKTQQLEEKEIENQISKERENTSKSSQIPIKEEKKRGFFSFFSRKNKEQQPKQEEQSKSNEKNEMNQKLIENEAVQIVPQSTADNSTKLETKNIKEKETPIETKNEDKNNVKSDNKSYNYRESEYSSNDNIDRKKSKSKSSRKPMKLGSDSSEGEDQIPKKKNRKTSKKNSFMKNKKIDYNHSYNDDYDSEEEEKEVRKSIQKQLVHSNSSSENDFEANNKNIYRIGKPTGFEDPFASKNSTKKPPLNLPQRKPQPKQNPHLPGEDPFLSIPKGETSFSSKRKTTQKGKQFHSNSKSNDNSDFNSDSNLENFEQSKKKPQNPENREIQRHKSKSAGVRVVQVLKAKKALNIAYSESDTDSNFEDSDISPPDSSSDDDNHDYIVEF
ncbi:hypothetical protein TRFO_06469 [Tritrichomonas foetus]|uniref:CDC48 N-terminal subdomain domain-containing protein n=1 Tax=Tritrichomonas foetus TaxID=1144522 RepID=A0A1J4JYA9_9EUKA|nr:hypothetical protein TRFO_06469 [Tritrichomonas foetus]|eukprot:OHT04145.1 hypothetical protein TRFO_06469 [Tritrichomonas foetus]